MANTTLVFSSFKDVNTMPTAVDTIARSTVKSSRRQIPFGSKQETNVSGLKVTENPLRWKEFQAMQPNLYLIQEDRVLFHVTNRPGISGLAGVLGKKLIHFVHL